MAVLLRGGAVFLHIPKTGGTWITEVLKHCGLVDCLLCHKHADVFRVLYGSWLPQGIDSVGVPNPPMPSTEVDASACFFCFVRHPLSWYESWWRYMTDHGWPARGKEKDKLRWHPNSVLNSLADNDFNSFVRKVIKVRPGYVTELYSSYTYDCVRFIGKQEKLADDLVAILRNLGLPFDEQEIREYKHRNVSMTSPQRATWDPGLRKEVLRLEYAGLVRYGYAAQDDPAW